jgi:hypothetical protein
MPTPRLYRPSPGDYPDADDPALTAQLDTAFPQSERDFLATYEPWVPKDLRGGDRRPHRHDGWTPETQCQFLLALRYHRSVKRAAASVGMSRENAYQLRRRWPPFARAWDLARGPQACTVADLLLRQVLEGVDEPIVRRGVVVGHRRVQRLVAGAWLLKQLKALERGQVQRRRRVCAPAGWRESGLVEALLGPGASGR